MSNSHGKYIYQTGGILYFPFLCQTGVLLSHSVTLLPHLFSASFTIKQTPDKEVNVYRKQIN